MCRLLGIAGSPRMSIDEQLGPEQFALFLTMSRLHRDGWGTAWRSDHGPGEIRIARDPDSPAPTAPTGPVRRALDVRSTARLVHLRMATAGLSVCTKNTHPFLADGVAFIHNGAVVPTSDLARLVDEPYLSELVGSTDSELYFALTRQHAAKEGSLLDGVCAAVTRLRGLFPRASLNAMLLSPDELIVVHSSEHAPTPHKEFLASGLAAHELPLGHLSEYFQISYTRTPTGAWAFTSTGLDTHGWTPLPPATVARVDLTSLVLHQRTLTGA